MKYIPAWDAKYMQRELCIMHVAQQVCKPVPVRSKSGKPSHCQWRSQGGGHRGHVPLPLFFFIDKYFIIFYYFMYIFLCVTLRYIPFFCNYFNHFTASYILHQYSNSSSCGAERREECPSSPLIYKYMLFTGCDMHLFMQIIYAFSFLRKSKTSFLFKKLRRPLKLKVTISRSDLLGNSQLG